MFKATVGHSEDIQPAAAIKEVLEQIQSDLNGLQPQAGLLYCSLELEHQLILSAIRLAFPDIELIGCTTDGEFSSVLGFQEDSITLMVFVTDQAEIKAGVGRQAAEGGAKSGREASGTAQSKLKQFAGKEQFAVILSDPLNAGISGINQGIEELLGTQFPIIGAASAAHSKKRQTYQFYNNEVLTNSIVMLLFAGSVRYSIGIMGGHAPMGGKEIVTKAEKNVLYRVGEETALEYFQRYIGEKYPLFMNYCLAIFEKDREGFYVRSAPYIDPEKGTVTLNGYVPEGAFIQIGTADKDTVAYSCKESIRQSLDAYSTPDKRPAAALCFSCAGRKMIMGTQIVQETQIARENMKDIPFIGFYAYGEFGPLRRGEPSLFHGTTFVSLLIGPA